MNIQNPALKNIETALTEHYGWSSNSDLREKISAAVEAKAGRLRVAPEEYCRIAAGSYSEMLALVEEVSLGETWFFRERHQFDYLRDAVFPQLLESNTQGIQGSQGSQGRRLRIWSAACSTGEEAYSLAIAYNQFKPSYVQTQAEVFATDVRNRALMDASKARYYEDSLRNVDPQTIGRYFERGEDLSGQPDESRLVIADIRKLVTFRRVNLLERVYWKGMSNRFDLIVCANLLVFFGHTAARQMVGNMAQSLRPGGYLMVAPNEGSLVVSPLLGQLKDHESFFQRTN